MEMMYKLDPHPSCYKVKAYANFRSGKDADLRMPLNRTLI